LQRCYLNELQELTLHELKELVLQRPTLPPPGPPRGRLWVAESGRRRREAAGGPKRVAMGRSPPRCHRGATLPPPPGPSLPCLRRLQRPTLPPPGPPRGAAVGGGKWPEAVGGSVVASRFVDVTRSPSHFITIKHVHASSHSNSISFFSSLHPMMLSQVLCASSNTPRLDTYLRYPTPLNLLHPPLPRSHRSSTR